MKMLFYHDQLIFDDIPDTVDLISQAFMCHGINIFSKKDLSVMYDSGMPGVVYVDKIGCIMDYLGYKLK